MCKVDLSIVTEEIVLALGLAFGSWATGAVNVLFLGAGPEAAVVGVAEHGALSTLAPVALVDIKCSRVLAEGYTRADSLA